MTDLTAVESLFLAALERPSPQDRDAYLDDACRDKPDLRQQVERLLAAHPKLEGFLDEPHPAAPADEAAGFGLGPATALHSGPAVIAGAVVAGRYKLLQDIGEGGMGSVWMAEQTRPVKRLVALKLIKPGMDSKAVLARFEAERQALALMDHPNIAKVLDGGTTEAGRPYFVMELVKGIPLTRYCDDRQLTLRQRLDLFVQVCSAVQHAHQKGIIHRDLKPSNVLVTEHDGTPMPKVIDFGLAKALHHQHALTERTLHTAFGTVVGTPTYMAPEQVALNALDVDTRTDVYSLGVILYELLTGTTPLEKKRFAEAAWEEIRRVIREEEPPRPSTRLSASNALPSIAARRQVEPTKLGKLVRGELDWIVMRALEKDRNRRYATANAFARDVQRYLTGEPVEACPQSAGYRVRKFARKHQAGLTAAAAFAAVLVAGVAVGTWQAIRATRAQLSAVAARNAETTQRQEADRHRDRAVQAEADAKRERDTVVAEKKRADEEAQVAQAVNEFLQQDLLGQAASGAQAQREFEPDPDIKVRTLLDRAGAEIGKRFANRPRVEAAIRRAIGNAYFGLTVYDPALANLSRAAELLKSLAPDDPDTLRMLDELARVMRATGRYSEAIQLYEQVRSRQIVVLGVDHPDTAKTLRDLAGTYQFAGRGDDAIRLLEQERDRQVGARGPDDPAALKTLQELARHYRLAGRNDDAIRVLQDVNARRKAVLGPSHPDNLSTMRALASAHLAAGQTSEGIRLLEDAHSLSSSALGPNHLSSTLILGGLGLAYRQAGRTAEAVRTLEEVRDREVATYGPDHRLVLNTLHNLATAYVSASRFDDAIRVNQHVLERRTAMLGPDNPDTLLILNNLAATYAMAGRTADAVRAREQLRDRNISRYGPDHARTQAAASNLASALLRAKQYERAASVCRESVAALSPKLAADDPVLADRLAQLGKVLLEGGGPAEAEPFLRECLDIREKKLPDDWKTFNARSLLGGSLVGQGRYASAEPLLVEGYQGLRQRETKIPAEGKGRVPEAQARLAEFIAATRKPGEAAKWEAHRQRVIAALRSSIDAELRAQLEDSPGRSDALARLGRLLLQAGLSAEAEPLLRECLAIREKLLPDDFRAFNAKALLGEALLGQQRYAEAEPLLLRGYEGLKQREATISATTFVPLPNLLERLVQLYDQTGKPEEAAKWRAERAKYSPPQAPATSQPAKLTGSTRPSPLVR